ncbi:hypothetical protein BDC45DRAFT_23144 [Circinella umbellata]|nr:hypothetical protein BDC45DRAFT_23144 [Circinella umbellata]
MRVIDSKMRITRGRTHLISMSRPIMKMISSTMMIASFIMKIFRVTMTIPPLPPMIIHLLMTPAVKITTIIPSTMKIMMMFPPIVKIVMKTYLIATMMNLLPILTMIMRSSIVFIVLAPRIETTLVVENN